MIFISEINAQGFATELICKDTDLGSLPTNTNTSLPGKIPIMPGCTAHVINTGVFKRFDGDTTWYDL